MVKCHAAENGSDISGARSDRGGFAGVFPPSAKKLGERSRGYVKPCGTDRDRVMRLEGRIERLLDGRLISGVSPSVEQASDRVQVEQMLQGQGDLRSHDLIERKLENGASRHGFSSSPRRHAASWQHRQIRGAVVNVSGENSHFLPRRFL
jgi:hypothetical protein